MIIPANTTEEKVGPERTIAIHFARLYQADTIDFSTVSVKEGATHFGMGAPPAMDIPV
jgi:hypothetical protein